jgi:hypothetical protein
LFPPLLLRGDDPVKLREPAAALRGREASNGASARPPASVISGCGPGAPLSASGAVAVAVEPGEATRVSVGAAAFLAGADADARSPGRRTSVVCRGRVGVYPMTLSHAA